MKSETEIYEIFAKKYGVERFVEERYKELFKKEMMKTFQFKSFILQYRFVELEDVILTQIKKLLK